MGVGELVVLDRAVLDVVADPLAKVLAHLQLLVARGSHRCLEKRTEQTGIDTGNELATWSPMNL